MSSCKINRMRIYYYFQEILVLISNQRYVIAHLFKFTDMHLFWLLFWWCQLNFKALLSFLCRSCSVFTVFPLLFPVVIFENQLMIYFTMMACMAICVIPWSLLPSVAVQFANVEIFNPHFHWPRLLPFSSPWEGGSVSQIIFEIPLFFPGPSIPHQQLMWKREESIPIEPDWHKCWKIRIWVHFCQFSLPWERS